MPSSVSFRNEHISERSLVDRVLRMQKKEFPQAYAVKFADKYKSGILDFLFILEGRHVWIELKTKIGRLSKLQEFTIDAIKRAGGEAYIARSVEEVRNILKGGMPHANNDRTGFGDAV